MKINPLLLAILSFLSYCFFTLLPAYSQTQANTNSQTQNSVVQKQPLSLDVFIDRMIIKEGESFTGKIWVASEDISSATVTVFFSKDHLQWKDTNVNKLASDIPLPMKDPINLLFTGKCIGKSNILIRVSGHNPII